MPTIAPVRAKQCKLLPAEPIAQQIVQDKVRFRGIPGIRHRITRKGISRLCVERTVSWLAGCRRLHRRYERKTEHFLAFVGLAALLIDYRRLARTIRA